MEKRELIDRLRKCKSAVDVYKLKAEIIRHLEEKPVKKSPKEDSDG